MIYIFPNFFKKGRKTWIFNYYFDIYQKNYYSYQKMFNRKFLDLFKTNDICDIFSHPIYFVEKIEFFIFDSTFHDSNEK